MKDPSRKGRTVPFTAEDRATLAEIERRNPAADRRRVCELFARAMGRAISRATLDRMRSGPDAGDLDFPEAPPPRKVATGVPLSDRDKAAIRELSEGHPRATPGQIAKLLRLRTGRVALPQTVAGHMPRLAPPGKRRNPHLTEAEREILLAVARDAGPEYCRTQIAREFAALAGRPISDASVCYFLNRTLGLPRIGPGRNSRSTGYDRSDDRIAQAHARKLDSAPVDRTVRPGHTSRIIA